MKNIIFKKLLITYFILAFMFVIFLPAKVNAVTFETKTINMKLTNNEKNNKKTIKLATPKTGKSNVKIFVTSKNKLDISINKTSFKKITNTSNKKYVLTIKAKGKYKITERHTILIGGVSTLSHIDRKIIINATELKPKSISNVSITKKNGKIYLSSKITPSNSYNQDIFYKAEFLNASGNEVDSSNILEKTGCSTSGIEIPKNAKKVRIKYYPDGNKKLVKTVTKSL